MKYFSAKISFILVITTILISCSVTKSLEEDEYFLTNNHITVNEEDSNDETIKNLIKPKPNSLFLKYPLRLRIYNFANKNPDSTFTEWLHKKPKREQRLHRVLSKKQTIKLQHAYTGINNWFKKSGEAPALIDSLKIKKSIKTLNKYHQQNGWLDINTSYTINYSDNKKGAVNYNIETGEPYIIDSITQQIESEAVDSIYNIHKKIQL